MGFLINFLLLLFLILLLDLLLPLLLLFFGSPGLPPSSFSLASQGHYMSATFEISLDDGSLFNQTRGATFAFPVVVVSDL